jgi:hypothetical protein
MLKLKSPVAPPLGVFISGTSSSGCSREMTSIYQNVVGKPRFLDVTIHTLLAEALPLISDIVLFKLVCACVSLFALAS